MNVDAIKPRIDRLKHREGLQQRMPNAMPSTKVGKLRRFDTEDLTYVLGPNDEIGIAKRRRALAWHVLSQQLECVSGQCHQVERSKA